MSCHKKGINLSLMLCKLVDRNSYAIACLVKNGESNIKLAVLAFEKAIAVKSYVDPEIITFHWC
jgi:hypothetical protein